jgi:predicted Zn-dependent protease
MSPLIAVIPIGHVVPGTVTFLTSDLGAALTAEILSDLVLPLPIHAFDSARQQYLARALVDALASQKRGEWTRLLGVTAKDLYAAGLNFVFGEVDVRRSIASNTCRSR